MLFVWQWYLRAWLEDGKEWCRLDDCSSFLRNRSSRFFFVILCVLLFFSRISHLFCQVWNGLWVRCDCGEGWLLERGRRRKLILSWSWVCLSLFFEGRSGCRSCRYFWLWLFFLNFNLEGHLPYWRDHFKVKFELQVWHLFLWLWHWLNIVKWRIIFFVGRFVIRWVGIRWLLWRDGHFQFIWGCWGRWRNRRWGGISFLVGLLGRCYRWSLIWWIWFLLLFSRSRVRCGRWWVLGGLRWWWLRGSWLKLRHRSSLFV